MISPNQNTEEITVLVVDDERDIADLYSTWLKEEYDVRTAYGATEALDEADDGVDVVFLDRQMPAMNGDQVLEVLRERELGCRVVMVTAVDPDFDIVNMPFDDYLTKPVMLEDLRGATERMLGRESYDERMQEFFSLASKKATLEAEKDSVDLQNNDEYEQLESDVETLRDEADQTVSDLSDAEDFETIFQEFPGDA